MNDAKGHGDVAHVEIYLPTDELLQLCVRDPKYILRKPLMFTNLDALFPGPPAIDVETNIPQPIQLGKPSSL